jgi:hypothetical protein
MYKADKLHNEELHNLYSSPSITRRIKSKRIRTRRGNTNACRILVGTPEEKRPLGRPKCKWENNIKINLRDTMG